MAGLYRPIIVCLVYWVLMGAQPAFGTHVIGGELYYECVDPNNHFYRITLLLYRDCTNSSNAEFDDPAYLGIYDDAGNLINGPIGTDLPLISRDTLPNETYQLCLFSPPNVCVEEGLYEQTIQMPPLPGGGSYTLVFQRCCRNDDIVNIPNPLGTGASWEIQVPDPSVADCNSSASYNIFPPTIICLNEEIVFDHSASDPDGDSLAYKLCNPHLSSLVVVDGSVPSPDPKPNFGNVPYNSGFSFQNPLGGTGPTQLQIDPVTGALSGRPQFPGQFVVGICVEEWRDGQLLTTNRRDFQFNVALCDTDLTAVFDWSMDTCSNTLTFTNESTRGTTYFWDFGVDTSTMDTSSAEHTSYQFKEIGTYNVLFIVNPATKCVDTMQQTIVISDPPLIVDFTFNDVCLGDTTFFADSSSSGSGSGSINSWYWEYGDGTTHNGPNPPSHVYEDTGSYPLLLAITTDRACTDTARGGGFLVNVFPIPTVDAGSDQTIMIGDSILLMPSSGFASYLWDPAESLSDSSLESPYASPTVTTSYNLNALDHNNCPASDQVSIEVLVPATIDVPTAFTPNNDALNDIFFVYDLLGFQGAGLSEFDLKIFNRWGELVFESDNINTGWDGNHIRNGKPSDIGVYVWMVSGTKVTGEKIDPIYGNVSLIR